MEVLKILSASGEWHDYSRFIKRKGCGWSRDDLDSENTVRPKNGRLRRDKITEKRNLSYDVMNMKRAELAQLDDDLSQPTFTATFLDLHGKQTREFYCSSFKATLGEITDEDGQWEDATFNMHEV